MDLPTAEIMQEAMALGWMKVGLYLILGSVWGTLSILMLRMVNNASQNKPLTTVQGWQAVVGVLGLLGGFVYLMIGIGKMIYLLVAPTVYVIRLLN